MSHNTNWMVDIGEFHELAGVYDIVDKMDKDKLKAFLEFRLACLQEELDEIHDAIQAGDSEGVVDGVVDMLYFGAGTLDLFGIRAHEAWAAVHAANMKKHPGVKQSVDGKPVRPNPFALPDMIKNADWTPPSHATNLGIVPQAF